MWLLEISNRMDSSSCLRNARMFVGMQMPALTVFAELPEGSKESGEHKKGKLCMKSKDGIRTRVPCSKWQNEPS